MNITKKQFEAYCKLQQSGKINMLDIVRGTALTGLTRDEYVFIIQHYAELKQRYAKQ